MFTFRHEQPIGQRTPCLLDVEEFTSHNSKNTLEDSTTGTIDHAPYRSLEQFRPRLIPNYLEIHGDTDVIVHEKIHGSNIQIAGRGNPNIGWTFQIGSRRRWIDKSEKFNNIFEIFDKIKGKIFRLFDYLYMTNQKAGPLDSEIVTIRLFGEVYGGKYGDETNPKAIRTQKEVNYCPFNDVAFFDINYNGKMLPVIKAHESMMLMSVNVVPQIYYGSLKQFLETFDVNKFNSVISYKFYGLKYLDIPNSTEGVTIRTVDPDATGDKAAVIKLKQTWALENKRLNPSAPKPVSENLPGQIIEALDLLNHARLVSWSSKNTVEDITNIRNIGENVKGIVIDTMKDVRLEFPNMGEENFKQIQRLLSKKAFPLFKKYISEM